MRHPALAFWSVVIAGFGAAVAAAAIGSGWLAAGALVFLIVALACLVAGS